MVPLPSNLCRVLAAACLAWTFGCGSLQAATVIACVGDSITQGYDASNQSTTAYPPQLQNLLGSGYTVLNFGHGGTTLIDGPDGVGYTRTSEYQGSLSSNPSIVIIQLGTNDANPDESWSTKSGSFVSQYVSLINTYKNLSTHPKVYLSLPIWAGKNAGNGQDDREPTLYYELLPLTRLVANLTGCEFIDNQYGMYKRFYDYGVAFGVADPLHPSDAGYAVLARSIYDFLIFHSTSANFGATGVRPENLDDQYTVNSIYNDTTKYGATGGIDRSGHSYSAKLLPALVGPSTISSLDWRDAFSAPVCSFFMGHADYKSAVSSGYVIPLPNDHFSAVRLLGAAVNGAQTNQVFTITYEDGGTTTQSISLSDWTSTGALQSNEGVVASVPYRTTYNGTTENVGTRLYGYTLSVDSRRVLKSVTLPANPNVVILGAALTGQGNATLGTLSKTTTGSFLAQANAKYVSAVYAAGAPLQASQATASTWETFDVTLVSGSAPNAFTGIFTLSARFNNSLVQTTAETSSDATAPMGANGPINGSTPTVASEYAWIGNYDGTFSLQSLLNGRYASLGGSAPANTWAGDGNKTVKASASTLTNTEKFTFK